MCNSVMFSPNDVRLVVQPDALCIDISRNNIAVTRLIFDRRDADKIAESLQDLASKVKSQSMNKPVKLNIFDEGEI